jgi:predicted GNAT family N-acyltransferase
MEILSKNEIKIFFKTLKDSLIDVQILYKINIDNNYKYYIFLQKIIVKKKKRNLGVGTSVMKTIIDFCEENNIKLTLNISDLYGSDINRLTAFYEKLGFIKNINGNLDGDYIYF